DALATEARVDDAETVLHLEIGRYVLRNPVRLCAESAIGTGTMLVAGGTVGQRGAGEPPVEVPGELRRISLDYVSGRIVFERDRAGLDHRIRSIRIICIFAECARGGDIIDGIV